MIDIENFSLNYRLFYLINHHRHPLLDVFYTYYYLLGKGWFGVFVGLVLFFSGSSGLSEYIMAMLLQAFVVKVLKYTVRAKRPSTVLEDVYLLERLRLKSFPSGDAAMSTTIALCLLKVSPAPLEPLLLAYPLLIGYGRVYMGAHFPLDVFTGWLIGVLCFLLVCAPF